MKKMMLVLSTLLLFFAATNPAKAAEDYNKAGSGYLALRVYHITDKQQEDAIDKYLQNAFIPAVHKMGIKTVGVFKPVGNDTAADKKVYVLIPFTSLDQFADFPQQLQKDKDLATNGKNYIEATYDKPTFTRFETILLRGFEQMPGIDIPQLSSAKKDRIYELRSYEGPSEKYYQNKVQMFNKGGEVKLFKRLGFNAVFYAEVLSGSRMPNLMYMTTFENKDSREEHWKAFNNDPEWKTLSALPEYQHNVSKADILFLTPTDYSDI